MSNNFYVFLGAWMEYNESKRDEKRNNNS
jgi:hypothetical protein